MLSVRCAVLLAGAAVSTVAWAADAPSAADLAARFGKRDLVQSISISPDGKHVAFVAPDAKHGTIAAVVDLVTGETKGVVKTDGEPLNLQSCNFASNSRIVCQEYGVQAIGGDLVTPVRYLAVNIDGTKPVFLGRKATGTATRQSVVDGTVIDWLDGEKPEVLMVRDYVPEMETGRVGARTRTGWGVDRVNTLTGNGQMVEAPLQGASEFITDGQGKVRIIGIDQYAGTDMLTGTINYMYRTTNERGWKPFSKWREDNDELFPYAVDGTRNMALASKPLGGREALYGVTLDGSMKTELLSSNPTNDLDNVITIGRHGRAIGATYVTDKPQVDYFDPDYKALAASLARALPKTPLILFEGASADEQKLLVFASSDTDPGRHYLLDRASKHMAIVISQKSELDGLTLSPVKPVTFRAADGTQVPAYLTLPPGGASKGLPAIVMPHGGPESRDVWEFNWLPQFFAQRGFAVIQPQFRGSAGYGKQWLGQKGFKSWRLAVGDVCDAARYLVKEGIADPSKLAIVGWSYGGYAALQSNVLDPDLFKAAVAIAPLTDFDMWRTESLGRVDQRLQQVRIGSAAIAQEGSPLRHAGAFKAPVLMFQGDLDVNVHVAESRAMDAALRHAGKQSTLVVFPGLDHHIDDSEARAKMLAQSDAFLRASMGM